MFQCTNICFSSKVEFEFWAWVLSSTLEIGFYTLSFFRMSKKMPALYRHCRVCWTWLARLLPTWSKGRLQRTSARRSTSRTTSLPAKKNRSERRTNGARRSEIHQSQLCHCWFHAWSHSLINNKRFDYFLCQICF